MSPQEYLSCRPIWLQFILHRAFLICRMMKKFLWLKKSTTPKKGKNSLQLIPTPDLIHQLRLILINISLTKISKKWLTSISRKLTMRISKSLFQILRRMLSTFLKCKVKMKPQALLLELSIKVPSEYRRKICYSMTKVDLMMTSIKEIWKSK